MNIAKLLSRWSLVGGILVILIGIAHTGATPMVYEKMAADFPDKAPGMAYMFGVMGVYVVLSGWLLVYASRGLLRREPWARTIVGTTATLNGLAGIGALLAGMSNILIVIWAGIGLSTCVLALVSRPRVAPA